MKHTAAFIVLYTGNMRRHRHLPQQDYPFQLSGWFFELCLQRCQHVFGTSKPGHLLCGKCLSACSYTAKQACSQKTVRCICLIMCFTLISDLQSYTVPCVHITRHVTNPVGHNRPGWS